MRALKALAGVAAVVLCASTAMAQDAPTPAPAPAAARPSGPPAAAALGAGPWTYNTAEGAMVVEVIARGLDHPWGMAFTPDGDMLVDRKSVV